MNNKNSLNYNFILAITKITTYFNIDRRPNRSWYGNGLFVSEEEFSALKDKVDKVKPQVSGF